MKWRNLKVNLKVKLENQWNFKKKFVRKIRRIFSILPIFLNSKWFEKEYEKNKEERLIDVKNTKLKNLDGIFKSKDWNLDKTLGWFLRLPDDFAYETWYLAEKWNYKQIKMEEDVLRHWNNYNRIIVVKTRSYGYLKWLIKYLNPVNWRGYWNYHFNDLDCKERDYIVSLLRKKLYSQPIKEIIKDIYYFWFPWEF